MLLPSRLFEPSRSFPKYVYVVLKILSDESLRLFDVYCFVKVGAKKGRYRFKAFTSPYFLNQ